MALRSNADNLASDEDMEDETETDRQDLQEFIKEQKRRIEQVLKDVSNDQAGPGECDSITLFGQLDGVHSAPSIKKPKVLGSQQEL